MGNGDEASGEGWLFRGRGALQLTGKFNYSEFAKYVNRPDVMTNPDLVAGELCFESALWFFDKNKLWSICDKGINEAAIRELSSRINGSKNPHGLDDRRMKTKKYAAWL
jgi:putative chitinase